MNESALFCTIFCLLKLLVCPFVCLNVYTEQYLSPPHGDGYSLEAVTEGTEVHSYMSCSVECMCLLLGDQ